MAVSLSLSSFISFISLRKSQTKASPLPNLASPTLSQKQGNDLTLVSMAAEELPSSTSPSLSSELACVLCPSLAYSNTLFFKSAYNVQVVVDDNEPEERLLNRFRREIMKAGVIQECKRRRFFENKQEENKRKTREAAKRNRKRRPQPRFSQQNKQEATTTKKDDEEEDNWDIPDGDLPY